MKVVVRTFNAECLLRSAVLGRAEPCDEVSSLFEASPIASVTVEGSGDDRTNTGGAVQASVWFVLAGNRPIIFSDDVVRYLVIGEGVHCRERQEVGGQAA